jgi:hypothetical protein
LFGDEVEKDIDIEETLETSDYFDKEAEELDWTSDCSSGSLKL